MREVGDSSRMLALVTSEHGLTNSDIKRDRGVNTKLFLLASPSFVNSNDQQA